MNPRCSFPMLIVCAVAALTFSAAAELKVTEGVSPFQVLQCDDSGTAGVTVSGTWSDTGDVFAQVTRDDEVILEETAVGAASYGAWSGVLEGIPVGGPYTISFRAGDDHCAIDSVLVGDLWVLAGQSNMQGVGNMIDVVQPHPQVHALAMNGVWRVAEEPLHILPESIDAVHAKFDSEEERATRIEAAKNAPKGAGLGLAFAAAMVEKTNRPVGLVCAAHGGTSMEQWSPEKRDESGASLYGSMLEQVRRAGGRVRGVLWYQGESDANPDRAPIFREKFEQFVAAAREDFDAPDLPFLYVQIGRFTHPDPAPGPWNHVQRMQLEAEQTIPNAGMAPSVDLELDDLIHIGTDGLKRLGNRLAALAERRLFGGTTLDGPRPEEISVENTPYGKRVRLRCSGVNGHLLAPGRAFGFSISAGEDGPAVPWLHKIELPADAPDTVLLWVHQLPENAHLWHGRGLDPCANIVDAADMAMPVFGPMPILE